MVKTNRCSENAIFLLNQSLSNYNKKFTIVAVDDVVDNISITANGTVYVDYTKFKSVSSHTRIVMNTSFENATTGGGGYSNAFIYGILYNSAGVRILVKNVANTGIKVKLHVTCLYFNSYIESSTIPTA